MNADEPATGTPAAVGSIVRKAGALAFSKARLPSKVSAG
jgi:hypothetical protein